MAHKIKLPQTFFSASKNANAELFHYKKQSIAGMKAKRTT